MTELNNTGDTGQATETGSAVSPPVYAPETVELMAKKNWKTDSDLSKGYIELEKFAGDPKSLLKLPADEKDTAGWDNVFNRLGRPETADKYEFENKTGIEVDPESFKTFRELAHKQGINKKQFNTLMEAHLNVFKNLEERAVKQSQADFEVCDKALKEKWGIDHPKRTAAAIDMADKLKIKELLTKKKLDNDPEVLEMLDRFVSMTSEGTLKQGGGDNTKTVEQELAELTKSDEFLNAMNPKHDEAMKRYLQLFGVKIS